MTKDIQLVNEDGTIVGRDPDTGNKIPISLETVEADKLSTVYTHRITSASGLETLDAGISQGSIVHVEQPDTPYRTSDWIDVDTSDVKIVFQSRFAKDGQPIVKPADGADVGGLRIGANASVENVYVENWGYHGNDTTMTDTVLRLHGLIVEDATDVDIDGVFSTREHPYHSHNDGGSSVTVRHQATDVDIKNVRGEDVGDRCIQVSGTDISIETVRTLNGFDRSVAFNVTEPDGSDYVASDVHLRDVIADTNQEGSVVGVGSTTNSIANSPAGPFTIEQIHAKGTHRRAVAINGFDFDIRAVEISGVMGRGGSREGIDLNGNAADSMTWTVSDYHLAGYGEQGIRVAASDVQIGTGAIDSPTSDGILFANAAHDAVVRGATVKNAGGNGIDGGGNASVGAFNCRVYGSSNSDVTGFGGTNSQSANNISG